MHVMGYNVLAILASAVAMMVWGFLWYSPLLFAKPWMADMGYDPNDKGAMEKMQKSAGPMYGISFLASLISSAMLLKVLDAASALTAYNGVRVGLAVWLGFVMTVQLTNNLFSMKPFRLFLINTSYQLACYLSAGAILGAWR